MNYQTKILLVLGFLSLTFQTTAGEKKDSLTIKGDMGIFYEGYGLNKTPGTSTPDFYKARKPWNLLRYSFNPVFSYGKWEIPVNFNFNLNFGQNNFNPGFSNFALPPGMKQNFWQFLTNPVNNFGIRPKIGNTEFLLGTQYIKYSDLSTGDLGIFGYGVNLTPGKFRIKLFKGVSQSPINYVAPSIPNPNGVPGAFQRNQWMAQLGLEKDGKYFAGFNIIKSVDKTGSVTSPPLSPIEPQENMVVSFLANVKTEKGWNYHIELGQSFFTRNLNAPFSITPVEDFKPFINSHTSTGKDNAVMLGIAKKGSDWEIGTKFNYYGAGYYTAGFQFMTNDKMEYLLNTHFNAWKKKMNIVGSIGERYGNLSRTAGPDLTKQLIANINVFTQFTDQFSMNAGFNNFGFNSPGLSGYKSVSNELTVNPVYTWNGTTMSNLLSGTYTWSKYDETTIIPPNTTKNNTQTALLLYVPTFFNSKISPDFSIMWFKNSAPVINLTLLAVTGGISWKMNSKFKLKGQLQYSLSTTSPFTANKNLLATSGFDWEVFRRLTWQLTATANVYHYGTELPGPSLTPSYPGNPRYFESILRTGLQYKF